MGILATLPMWVEFWLLLFLAGFFRYAAAKDWVTGRTYRRNIPLFLAATAFSLLVPGAFVFVVALIWTCVLILWDALFPQP
jgi:hypothetical protein